MYGIVLKVWFEVRIELVRVVFMKSTPFTVQLGNEFEPYYSFYLRKDGGIDFQF